MFNKSIQQNSNTSNQQIVQYTLDSSVGQTERIKSQSSIKNMKDMNLTKSSSNTYHVKSDLR